MPSQPGLWYSPVKWLEGWSHCLVGQKFLSPWKLPCPPRHASHVKDSRWISQYVSKIYFILCVSFSFHPKMQTDWRQELSLMESEQSLTLVDIHWMLNNNSDHVITMPKLTWERIPNRLEFSHYWQHSPGASWGELKTSAIRITFPIRNTTSSLE